MLSESPKAPTGSRLPVMKEVASPMSSPPPIPTGPNVDPATTVSAGRTTRQEAANAAEEHKKALTRPSEIHPEVHKEQHVLSVNDFCLYYGKHKALHNITMPIGAGKVTALVGPSGCGKSTLLRSINRLNDLIDTVRTEGEIKLRGQDVYAANIDIINLRKQLGMVFQKSNPFPMSIFENVIYARRIAGEHDRRKLHEVCERSLRGAALWEEVKDRLNASALGLSGGQQQRLCIARAIAAEPEVLLMDEPCSALDPIATAKVEDLIHELRGKYTVVIVTHNMQQAARVSDYTAFMYLGRLIEYGPTGSIFQNPRLKQTEDYITGRFG